MNTKPPELKKHIKESFKHNDSVLKRLAKGLTKNKVVNFEEQTADISSFEPFHEILSILACSKSNCGGAPTLQAAGHDSHRR